MYKYKTNVLKYLPFSVICLYSRHCSSLKPLLSQAANTVGTST